MGVKKELNGKVKVKNIPAYVKAKEALRLAIIKVENGLEYVFFKGKWMLRADAIVMVENILKPITNEYGEQLDGRVIK
jgi:hypothetical protein